MKKSKPQTIEELALANDLMRLMSEDVEQPIDKFVRHKENIDNWYKEMQDYNLTQEEVGIMEEHLKEVYGVSATQEAMMLLLLDERICGFSVAEVNDARRVVGKKIMKDIPRIKEMVFSKGDASDNLRRYIWDTQIATQMGYSFSTLHSTAYSLIALQEMNLAHLYPRVFWDVACLTVSAGADESNRNNKSTDYGRIASAIGKMKSHGVQVTSPLINQAEFGFIPDDKSNRIVFGLKGINGINDDTIRTIIAHRPYSSFEDFHERMYKSKLVTRGQVLQLIKAGCFNEFDSPAETMRDFLVKETPVRETLNGQNLSRVINLGLFNTDEYEKYHDYYNFRAHLKKKVYERLENPKNRILLLDDEHSKIYFDDTFSDKSVHGYHENYILIDEKEFEKEYKELMKPAMELLKDREFIKQFNIAQFHELWNEHAQGSLESWYFEATSFYPDKHELEDIDEKRYGIRKFRDLSETPVVVGERESRNGRVYQELELYNIAGTVLDKNRNSHSITVLTKDGVITVKTYAGAFANYDRQIKTNGSIVEKSWFTRGERLLFTGFRRDDQFVLRAPRGQHTINKILNVRPDGSIALQAERARV